MECVLPLVNPSINPIARIRRLKTNVPLSPRRNRLGRKDVTQKEPDTSERYRFASLDTLTEESVECTKDLLVRKSGLEMSEDVIRPLPMRQPTGVLRPPKTICYEVFAQRLDGTLK